MESNKKALIILQMLVVSAVVIFLVEQKFLVVEARGATLSQYEHVRGVDKVLLLVEDFEGISTPETPVKGDSLLMTMGFFSYGSAKIAVDHKKVDKNPLASKTGLELVWNSTEGYGGWGRGVGANIELNPLTDYVNFRVLVPKSNGHDETIRILMEEDDNDNAVLEPELDDKWGYKLNITARDEWQIISVPLKEFKDENPGGDGQFNVTRKGGLHNIIFNLEQPDKYQTGHRWYFDFICFSSEIMNDNLNLK